MKSLILLGLVVTLSSVFCKEHQVHNRQNVPQRKYKDTKSKRGIGDYPLNLSFGAPSIGSFQPAGHVTGPFSSGLPNFGSYGGYGSGNLLSNPIGLQTSPSFSVIGSPSFSGLQHYGGLSQPVSLNQQSTEYAASAPTLNLASLLGGQASFQNSYASPSIGLFSAEKTGPVTFSAQTAEQPRQQYTPVYATAHSAGSSRIATPLILGSSSGYQLGSASSGGYQLGSSSSGGLQLGSSSLGGLQFGSNLQRHSLAPATLRSLSSIGSLSSNGVGYTIPASLSSSPLSRDSSSHTVSGGYIIAGASPAQSGSSPTYTISGPSLSSSPSTSDYMISVPSASSSSSSPTYQLSAATSSYSASPSNSFSTNFAKYNPSSSDASAYSGSSLKLNSFTNYGSPSSSSSTSGNYASSGPNYSNSASTTFSAPPDSSGSSRHPVTSYGTPATSYSIPSTSYGVPTSSQYVSNLNYNSQSSDTPNSSSSYTPNSGSSYTPSSVSTYSRPAGSYGSSSISPSYDSIKNLDSSIKMSSVSFSDPAMNYGSGSSSASSDYSSFKNQPHSVSSSLSNSVESYTPPSAASSSYESGPDSSSSYSNPSPRYLRYHGDRPTSSPYIENDDSPGSSSYDTISYSVPMGKY